MLVGKLYLEDTVGIYDVLAGSGCFGEVGRFISINLILRRVGVVYCLIMIRGVKLRPR